jgi:hypothetical protein
LAPIQALIHGAERCRSSRGNRPVALQDLLDQAWTHPISDPRAEGENRRRERSMWSHQAEPGPIDRRPPPPSGRMHASHMPRRMFLGLAFGWGAIVAALLGVILAIRWFG